MKRAISPILMLVALAFLASPLAAQRGQGDVGLQSTGPDPMHPMEGTIIADLVPVNGASEDATGRATFNYVRGRDEVVARVNVEGLEPGTEYQVHVAVHRVRAVGDLVEFTTDDDGNGVAFVRLACLEAFNLINIRQPGVVGSRTLTSWYVDGGSLEQTPDRRSRGTPPETCPGD